MLSWNCGLRNPLRGEYRKRVSSADTGDGTVPEKYLVLTHTIRMYDVYYGQFQLLFKTDLFE